jgi:hypothetical protein
MEISLKSIVTDQFKTAFQKLITADGLSAKHSFRLLRFAREIVKHQKTFDQANQKVCEKYARRKEDGSIDILEHENGNRSYQFDQNNANLFSDEMNELISEVVSLPSPPLTEEDVEKMSLNVVDIESLLGIVIEWSDK